MREYCYLFAVAAADRERTVTSIALTYLPLLLDRLVLFKDDDVVVREERLYCTEY